MSVTGATLALLEGSGVLGALERTVGRGGVVAYHSVVDAPFLPELHISAALLEHQLEFLAQHYSIITLDEFVTRRRAGRSLRGCVAITFDDGYRSVATHALPILRRLQMPATVFVATAYATTGHCFWWDRIGWLSKQRSREEVAPLYRALELPPAGGMSAARTALLQRHAGCLPRIADRALCALEECTVPVPVAPLTEPELRQLGRCDLIDFAPHTVRHPALPYLAQRDQEAEIRQSHTWLAERLPRTRPMVAYPYGLYDRTTAAAARAAGMAAGFGLPGRAATSRFDLYAAPRIALAEVNGIRSLRVQLAWCAIPAVAWRRREWHPRLPPRTADADPTQSSCGFSS